MVRFRVKVLIPCGFVTSSESTQAIGRVLSADGLASVFVFEVSKANAVALSLCVLAKNRIKAMAAQ